MEPEQSEEKKPLLPRRSSRLPLMHPQYYTASPTSNHLGMILLKPSNGVFLMVV